MAPHDRRQTLMFLEIGFKIYYHTNSDFTVYSRFGELAWRNHLTKYMRVHAFK